MAFDNPSNRGRALKIVEILAHVGKSATSNRASADEIREILAPAVQKLRELGAIESVIVLDPQDSAPVDPAPKASPEATTPPLSAGQRAALILADQASLPVLIAALSGRLDAHAGKLNPDLQS